MGPRFPLFALPGDHFLFDHVRSKKALIIPISAIFILCRNIRMLFNPLHLPSNHHLHAELGERPFLFLRVLRTEHWQEGDVIELRPDFGTEVNQDGFSLLIIGVLEMEKVHTSEKAPSPKTRKKQTYSGSGEGIIPRHYSRSYEVFRHGVAGNEAVPLAHFLLPPSSSSLTDLPPSLLP
nr:hypothetical protein Iba_chr05bCG2440 [Ipomoea batatas]